MIWDMHGIVPQETQEGYDMTETGISKDAVERLIAWHEKPPRPALPDTKIDRESVERLARMLEDDAEQQNFQPPEMTGLLPDDEHEIATTLRALLAARERDAAVIEELRAERREREISEAQALGALTPNEARAALTQEGQSNDQ